MAAINPQPNEVSNEGQSLSQLSYARLFEEAFDESGRESLKLARSEKTANGEQNLSNTELVFGLLCPPINR
ncbi:MAG: hypothetical protein DKT66_11250 [Candidatus Melainabacteria bacterium]|nr:MAG: hypothetical protein DKT66_11250 [Candidatus Melainabacteria bacterium]